MAHCAMLIQSLLLVREIKIASNKQIVFFPICMKVDLPFRLDSVRENFLGKVGTKFTVPLKKS